MDPQPEEVTALLRRVAAGDEGAKTSLFQLLYEELREAAYHVMRHRDRRPEHTLQPTVLVHEMFLRLTAAGDLEKAQNRRHLFAMATVAFRRILVEHHRARTAQKRGGDGQRIPLDDLLDTFQRKERMDLEELNEALDELHRISPEQAEVVCRKYFWNQTYAEIGRDLDCTADAAEGKWRAARAWLFGRLDKTGHRHPHP